MENINNINTVAEEAVNAVVANPNAGFVKGAAAGVGLVGLGYGLVKLGIKVYKNIKAKKIAKAEHEFFELEDVDEE